MRFATCRCGTRLKLPEPPPERVTCPKCRAQVRVKVPPAGAEDGYLRFLCPCGRRLKVSALDPPANGKCPECGRVVPVPPQGLVHSESKTAELGESEVAAVRAWAARHQQSGSRDPSTRPMPGARPARGVGAAAAAAQAGGAPVKAEAGLRVCPSCGKPVHLGSETCRTCGIVVPRP